MKILLIGLLFFAQHHTGYGGTVVIPKNGEIRVKFDPPFDSAKPVPNCFFSPSDAVTKWTATHKKVDIKAKPGVRLQFNCTQERAQ